MNWITYVLIHQTSSIKLSSQVMFFIIIGAKDLSITTLKQLELKCLVLYIKQAVLSFPVKGQY